MKVEPSALISKILVADAGLPAGISRRVAAYFSDIEEFLGCTRQQLMGLRTASGNPLRLGEDVLETILETASSGLISPSVSVQENYIRAIARDFTRRQLSNIKAIALDNLNVNPLLVRSLNLKTPHEMLEFNIYAAVSRSIVTSMGYFVQDLLSITSDSVEKVRAGWDMVKHGDDGTNHWIQIKSGPNDMDKDQIVYWLSKIEDAEAGGDRGYIGITYGKRGNNTVSLSLMRTYLPDMEVRTLIGRELWDFLSGDAAFHERLFDSLRLSASRILGSHSVEEEIRACIDRVHEEFRERFGDGEGGLEAYISSIF